MALNRFRKMAVTVPVRKRLMESMNQSSLAEISYTFDIIISSGNCIYCLLSLESISLITETSPSPVDYDEGFARCSRQGGIFIVPQLL